MIKVRSYINLDAFFGGLLILLLFVVKFWASN